MTMLPAMLRHCSDAYAMMLVDADCACMGVFASIHRRSRKRSQGHPGAKGCAETILKSQQV